MSGSLRQTFPKDRTCLNGHAPILPLFFIVLTCALSVLSTRAAPLPSSTNSLGMIFVQLPPGEFLMGSPQVFAEAMAKKVTADWYRDSAPSEAPQRRVKTSRAFDLGKTEVTLGQFRKF